ncbi:MAG: hypothetical protein WCF36_11300 [Candidatus Nanopelagicales bacterium]
MTRRIDVAGVVLLLAAVAVGTWLGLSAPDASPIFTEGPLVGGHAGGTGNGGGG